MKVSGNDDSKKAVEALRILKQDSAKKNSVEQAKDEKTAKSVREDKVNVSLGRLLQQELDPNEIASTQKQRVEELKKLIAIGQYKVPSEKIAAAMAREISLEVLTSKGKGELIPADDEDK